MRIRILTINYCSIIMIIHVVLFQLLRLRLCIPVPTSTLADYNKHVEATKIIDKIDYVSNITITFLKIIIF